MAHTSSLFGRGVVAEAGISENHQSYFALTKYAVTSIRSVLSAKCVPLQTCVRIPSPSVFLHSLPTVLLNRPHLSSEIVEGEGGTGAIHKSIAFRIYSFNVVELLMRNRFLEDLNL